MRPPIEAASLFFAIVSRYCHRVLSRAAAGSARPHGCPRGEDRPSYDGWRRKIGPSPRMIFRPGSSQAFFGRPASLLHYANRMSSRFNRGASASALTVRGQPCDFGVSEKLGWTRRRVRDWIKPNPEMPDGNPSPGIRPWARNRSSFTFASQKCFPNHAQARTDAGLRPL
jgi:hypothetical protein